MKHLTKSRRVIDAHNSIVVVELLPDNESEQTAIRNLEVLSASDSERESVENYIHFNSGISGQVVDASQTGNVFTLKVFH